MLFMTLLQEEPDEENTLNDTGIDCRFCGLLFSSNKVIIIINIYIGKCLIYYIKNILWTFFPTIII